MPPSDAPVAGDNERRIAATREIRERIRSAGHLSPGEQKVADFYLDSLPGSAFLNSAMVSQACDVSTATVTRFTHRVGFRDFREFTAWMMGHARTQLERPADRRAAQESGGRPLAAAFHRARHDLAATIDDLDPDAFELTVDLLADDRRPLHLAAVASGQPLMQHFGMLLSYLRGGITVLDGTDRWPHQLAGLNRDGVVLAAAYDRDALPVAGLLELAHDAGAASVVITNQHRSPLIRLADTALVTSTQRGSMFGSRVSTLCLLEALLDAVALRLGGRGDRAAAIERAFDTLSIHPERR